jgi:hypothetical protein
MPTIKRLHGIHLTMQTEIAPGIFFALDNDSNGRLHDGKEFLGYAMPQPGVNNGLYQVQIFSTKLLKVPFTRNGYRTLFLACSALKSRAITAYRIKQNENQPQKKEE